MNPCALCIDFSKNCFITKKCKAKIRPKCNNNNNNNKPCNNTCICTCKVTAQTALDSCSKSIVT